MKPEICRQILVNLPNIKFHGNPFNRSRVVTRLQTDGRSNFNTRSARLRTRLQSQEPDKRCQQDFFVISSALFRFVPQISGTLSPSVKHEEVPAASIIRTTHRPVSGGSKHLWNVSKLLPVHTAQPRRQPSWKHNPYAWQRSTINWLMLFREITAVYSENHMKPINIL
jgi:hypothetical protein